MGEARCGLAPVANQQNVDFREDPPLSHEQACRLLEQLNARPRTMPSVRMITQHEADQLAALRIVGAGDGRVSRAV